MSRTILLATGLLLHRSAYTDMSLLGAYRESRPMGYEGVACPKIAACFSSTMISVVNQVQL